MATQNYEQELNSIKADVTALRKDIADLVNAMGKDAKDRVNSAADVARQYGQQSAHLAESQITEHPFASVAVAFSTGLLLGRLLNGR